MAHFAYLRQRYAHSRLHPEVVARQLGAMMHSLKYASEWAYQTWTHPSNEEQLRFVLNEVCVCSHEQRLRPAFQDLGDCDYAACNMQGARLQVRTRSSALHVSRARLSPGCQGDHPTLGLPRT